MELLNRRRVLKGMLHGSAVTVALPLLNCFLNNNGTALASGEPLPVRFGTWFWALGMNEAAFYPRKAGQFTAADFASESMPLKDVANLINIFSKFNVLTDSFGSICHHTGWIATRTGICPSSKKDFPGQTIDVTISNKIGDATRFRALNVSATGNNADTVAYVDQNSPIAAESKPIALYQRLFGPDFQDPNAASFTPNPTIMVRKSVLSAILDKSHELNATVGAEDKARIDQYFTSVRELEKQLDLQLQKPRPIAACVRPKAEPEEFQAGTDVELVKARHRVMTQLLVMAVTCDQTRVINLGYSAPFAETTFKGLGKNHHACTHEEAVDQQTGYQPTVHQFTIRAMEEWAYFVSAFNAMKEGDGTLLDNMIVMAHSDQSFAKVHGLTNMPMFTAGRAGGKIKCGQHVVGNDTPATRLGYTLQRLMGVQVESWGYLSNKTSKEIGEILV